MIHQMSAALAAVAVIGEVSVEGSRLRAGQPRVIGNAIEVDGLLDPGGASLVYAGYPYNPYA
jgi:hypothetical protein